MKDTADMEKVKAEFARALARRMQIAFDHGKVKRALKPEYIENQIEAWGVWPIASITKFIKT